MLCCAPMPELKPILAALRRSYGKPAVPPARNLFEHVMWENAVYLLPDERRAEVFAALRQRVELTPKAVLSAKKDVLLELAKRGGIWPETRVFRWQEIARITVEHFGGDLDQVLKLPYAAAKKALKLFPTIGDPGAEKILMYCGAAQGLPLESNGLRVLTRIGFGREQKNYGAMYKSAQEAIAGQIPAKSAAIAEAHLLLRQHGKETCKVKDPLCHSCPVQKICAYPSKRLKLFGARR